MRDSKRDTDVKNRLLDSVGEGKGEMSWNNSSNILVLFRFIILFIFTLQYSIGFAIY